MPTGEASFTIRDYSDETSIHRINITQLSAANFDAILGAGGTVPDYFDALDGIVIGNIARERIAAVVVEISGAPAGSVWAQVEMKWLVPYVDSVTGKAYRTEIPCPDLTLLAAGSDNMNMTLAAAIAFKTAFELLAVSDVGNAVTMGVPYIVGRNN